MGGSAVSELYTTTVKAARSQQSRALFWFKVGPSNDNVLVIEFGSSKDNYHNGCLTGYIPFSGNEQLALTMPSDFVAGSYEIRVEYLAAARMNISKGQVSVHPS